MQTGLADASLHTNHCAGISSSTLWQLNGTRTITMKIATTECNFHTTPLYFVSMAGINDHVCLHGYHGIDLSTRESFQIYVQFTCFPMNSTVLLSLSQSNAFDVNWVGFYRYNIWSLCSIHSGRKSSYEPFDKILITWILSP